MLITFLDVVVSSLASHPVQRLLLAAFFHMDEMHLVYNMISFLWKGVELEPAMGSKVGACTIAIVINSLHHHLPSLLITAYYVIYCSFSLLITEICVVHLCLCHSLKLFHGCY